ncbi:Gfo/Idh/MocA family oxidoreductase [Chloroflexi bacterium TSY]|nr:Gfo/Idh/MocA family oxidoreductase [Chloroflexi bacterium TSY]
MSNQTIRCLTVGWGGISNHMAQLLLKLPWYETAGVVDVRGEALARAQETLGISADVTFKHLNEALKKVAPDAVLINTPSELHYEQAKESLRAGAHTLVAKPITNSFEDAVELVKLAEDVEPTLSVGQQVRYNRHYQVVAQFVHSGQLGRPEGAWFMNSKPRPNALNLARMKQPALYETSCHHFDSFLAVFDGYEPEWISCDGFIPSWSPYVGPCMINALIRFSGGLHLAYHGGFSAQSSMYEFRIEGMKGALRCHGLHMSKDTMSYQFAPALGQFEEAAIDNDVPLQTPFLPFFDIWQNYMAGGEEPPFSGRNNLKVFAMLSAAIDSIETGQPVEIAGNPRYREAFLRLSRSKFQVLRENSG